MKKPLITCLVALSGFVSQFALAGNCEINITRTACPGQEQVSYQKCNGQQSCTEASVQADAVACKAHAVSACENQRLTVTKSKVITAKFEGQALKTDKDQADFCLAYANRATEFDKCGQ